MAKAAPFYNDISGEGGLWMRGSGTLTLAGNNTYRGDTFVDEGTLRLTGLNALGGRLTGSGSQMAIYARTDLGRKGYLSRLVSHGHHIVDTQRRVLVGNMLSSVIG